MAGLIFSTDRLISEARDQGRIQQLLSATEKAQMAKATSDELLVSAMRAEEIAAQSHESASRLILNT